MKGAWKGLAGAKGQAENVQEAGRVKTPVQKTDGVRGSQKPVQGPFLHTSCFAAEGVAWIQGEGLCGA